MCVRDRTPGERRLLFGPDHDYGATCTDLVSLSPPPVEEVSYIPRWSPTEHPPSPLFVHVTDTCDCSPARKLARATASLAGLAIRREALLLEMDALRTATRGKLSPSPPPQAAPRRGRGRGLRRPSVPAQQAPGAFSPSLAISIPPPSPQRLLAVAPRMRPPHLFIMTYPRN